MGIYNKLADDIDEVDIIIAGGLSTPLPPFHPTPTDILIPYRRYSRLHYRRTPRRRRPYPLYPRHRRRRKQQRCSQHRTPSLIPPEPDSDHQNCPLLQR
jgi:hypothetical protein